ncbi:hypothetical protein RW25_07170 [Bacillus sp. L_1B0_8]|uniref:hypothetical protein n=1 Tax=unclassified Bacillus (in: firmicutes) TaxID=185979 RepID=UPI0005B72C7E|nr:MULTISPECIES: hypothetical protein [unclassified Bacillus (in: firmicutes)]KIQ88495.1 hypothetical protein RT27_09955 [Bacillus sp. L_1B0_5]KIQ90878.1 hypothetical protein RW25_07170 [Bacillus sp. L_1B0_8]
MSSRAFKRLLIHSCTLVKKGVIVGKDENGRNQHEDQEITDVPCRLDTIRKKIEKTDKSIDTVEKNILFMLPSGDVAAAVQVKNIRMRKTPNDIVLSGVFSIPEKNPIYGRKSIHHYEIELEKVRK